MQTKAYQKLNASQIENHLPDRPFLVSVNYQGLYHHCAEHSVAYNQRYSKYSPRLNPQPPKTLSLQPQPLRKVLKPLLSIATAAAAGHIYLELGVGVYRILLVHFECLNGAFQRLENWQVCRVSNACMQRMHYKLRATFSDKYN